MIARLILIYWISSEKKILEKRNLATARASQDKKVNSWADEVLTFDSSERPILKYNEAVSLAIGNDLRLLEYIGSSNERNYIHKK